MPPDVPLNVTATVTATGPISTVIISWQITPTADISDFIVYRAFAISVTLQANCADEHHCWREVTRTTSMQWHDLDPSLEQVRWYRLQAVDQNGNRSRYTAPVQAILHDITPPTPPTVTVIPCDTSGGQSQGYCISATPTTTDTTRYRIYCQFSPDGVMMPISDTTQINNFKLESIYAPPYPLQNVTCQVRAADAHGNLSTPAPFLVPWMLSPRPLVVPTPIITTVNTALGGINGYSAQLFWDVNDAAGLSGFRIDREAIYRPNNGPVGDVASFSVNSGVARSYGYLDRVADRLQLYRHRARATGLPLQRQRSLVVSAHIQGGDQRPAPHHRGGLDHDDVERRNRHAAALGSGERFPARLGHLPQRASRQRLHSTDAHRQRRADLPRYQRAARSLLVRGGGIRSAIGRADPLHAPAQCGGWHRAQCA